MLCCNPSWDAFSKLFINAIRRDKVPGTFFLMINC